MASRTFSTRAGTQAVLDPYAELVGDDIRGLASDVAVAELEEDPERWYAQLVAFKIDVETQLSERRHSKTSDYPRWRRSALTFKRGLEAKLSAVKRLRQQRRDEEWARSQGVKSEKVDKPEASLHWEARWGTDEGPVSDEPPEGMVFSRGIYGFWHPVGCTHKEVLWRCLFQDSGDDESAPETSSD